MRRGRRTRSDWDEHLSGARATFDGECPRCGDKILVDMRVVRHRDGWIHIQCASGWDE